jgi:Carboxypeptidase regulatory-like domain
MAGYVTDPSGAVVPNTRVTITADNGASRSATTDAQGRWLIAGLPSGNYTARADASGFKSGAFNLNYNAGQPSMYDFPLSVGATTETVEVSGAQVAQIQTESGTNQFHGDGLNSVGGPVNGRSYTELMTMAPGVANPNSASANVMNLQRRVAGVLPVAIDVPHAGTSFSFVRPLVLDEETKVTFSYRSR